MFFLLNASFEQKVTLHGIKGLQTWKREAV